jgi:putative FmdB family regulatory protein
MPIFEYVCESCGHPFEAIVMGSQQAECPKCKAHNLQQQLSKFAAHSKSSASESPCSSGGPCCMGRGGCDMN